MDIPQRTILGGDIHKISRPAARRLSCNKREVMEKYNDLLEIFCSQHRIQQKLYTLFPPTYPPSPTTAAKMEVIDRVLDEGMIHAVKKCRKIRAGEVPFSDKLVKASCRIKLWRLVIRHKRSNNVSTRTIHRAAKKCNLTQVLTVSIETARHYLKCAWTNYKIHKKSAPRLRDEFLHDQEEKAISPKAKKAISMIRRHEETRSSWRTINRCHGKTRNKGISCVETKVNGQWQKLTARDEVEAAIMANNTERFHLTRFTPLMSQHMSTRLGYLAEHEVSKSILNNEFVPDPLLDKYTNKFLSFISNRTQLPAITVNVMKEDFIYFWKGTP